MTFNPVRKFTALKDHFVDSPTTAWLSSKITVGRRVGRKLTSYTNGTDYYSNSSLLCGSNGNIANCKRILREYNRICCAKTDQCGEHPMNITLDVHTAPRTRVGLKLQQMPLESRTVDEDMPVPSRQLPPRTSLGTYLRTRCKP